MENIGKEVTLESFVPRYQNQAINFTGEDMGSDRAMIIVLLYMVIVIMAFVFGVTISNTIRNEAAVIGTLRASGYTRKELIHHYMVLPICVTLAGALIGNILGYTVLKMYVQDVLRQLQSADLCDYMECRCVYQNNIGSDPDPDVDQLRDLAQQAVDVTAQIYAERISADEKRKRSYI